MAELLPLQDDDVQKQKQKKKHSTMVDPETGKTIPMKDGKPCRVCVDFKTWSKLEKQKAHKEGKEKHDSTTSKDTTAGTVAAGATAAAAATAAGSGTANDKADSQQLTNDEWRKQNCPPDVETLGNATWTLLHTMAAYYPEKPEPKEKQSMKSFMSSFAEHYPCWFCKNDFQKAMQNEPVDVESRESLSQWLCRRHNEVNQKLNKPKFDCSKVFERWLNGPPDGRCD
ncbi:ERV/ALR sulfhydryl oxidase domain-containing protein [Radiomyces spectabilis]|uniref:ERV/ALR sulfhydryl oxidase domain-containing protein n=1 Tax=Radiomyces spectabilis TaxID=64574 RepID=UPI00221FBAFC|nr:ERV/ALR sulfhydryl oxidase domain-containing protein [Radiomyces spectabilis]KAI8391043.1 ERV/ALR sulfhydryl oxidase domain-containing protein [Radiomyces spectabilis]